jgi:hypothetical protein
MFFSLIIFLNFSSEILLFSLLLYNIVVKTMSKLGSLKPVLWIRIRKDPKLFAGCKTGSVTQGYGFGSGSRAGLETYQKSLKS